MKHLAIAIALLACSKAGKPSPSGPSFAARPIEIRDQPGFLFTYLDEDGQQRQTEKRADIPESRRDNVRVIDLSLPPDARGAGRIVYVADLRSPRADGTFPYRMMSTVSFEQAVVAQSEQGRVDEALKNAATQVTIYSTSWCGACARARAFLQQQGVAFVDRDVEADHSAQVELSAKAKRAGVQPRGVPVLDVYGELILGFDEAAVKAALARHRS